MGEREAVVAWLLSQVEKGHRAMASAKEGSKLQRDYAVGVVVISNAADAIERGEHLNEGIKQ